MKRPTLPDLAVEYNTCHTPQSRISRSTKLVRSPQKITVAVFDGNRIAATEPEMGGNYSNAIVSCSFPSSVTGSQAGTLKQCAPLPRISIAAP
jgi:hypothetical protein